MGWKKWREGGKGEEKKKGSILCWTPDVANMEPGVVEIWIQLCHLFSHQSFLGAIWSLLLRHTGPVLTSTPGLLFLLSDSPTPFSCRSQSNVPSSMLSQSSHSLLFCPSHEFYSQLRKEAQLNYLISLSSHNVEAKWVMSQQVLLFFMNCIRSISTATHICLHFFLLPSNDSNNHGYKIFIGGHME
jgi:hypothetical protein